MSTVYLRKFRCDACGVDWSDVWDDLEEDRCPDCHMPKFPSSHEIMMEDNELTPAQKLEALVRNVVTALLLTFCGVYVAYVVFNALFFHHLLVGDLACSIVATGVGYYCYTALQRKP